MPVKELQTLSKKKLYLIITNYPNNGSDSIFVAPEIPELMKWFDITVFCTSGKRDCTHVRDGIEYFYFDMELTLAKKIKYIFKYFGSGICRKDLKDIIKMQNLDKKSNLLGRIRKSIEFYGAAEEFYGFFQEKIKPSDEEAVYYTFWNDYFTLSLILHKYKYPNFHIVTRLHGYDLYEYRCRYGRQPFKQIMNAEMERLYFIAENPKEYYVEKYPELNRDKVKVNRLGVYEISKKEERFKGKKPLIVSCSNVIALKRVNLIIEALEKLEEEVCWIHFGDGSQFAEISQMAKERLEKKRNIEYKLEGRISNEDIRKFYGNNEIRCFVTTSSTEGCPISIMEAMAAGIPVVATSVGEIPNMINGNGILLEQNPKAQNVAEALEKIINCSSKKWEEMSRKSYLLWKKSYNADLNAAEFAEELNGI
ncbi:MAG: glycosyltransferase [Eisenbergiella sp.]|nr:glycosyltransferase [Bacillota bacterium]